MNDNAGPPYTGKASLVSCLTAATNYDDSKCSRLSGDCGLYRNLLILVYVVSQMQSLSSL